MWGAKTASGKKHQQYFILRLCSASLRLCSVSVGSGKKFSPTGRILPFWRRATTRRGEENIRASYMNFLNAALVAICLLVSCAWAQPVIHWKAGTAGAPPSRTLPRHGRATHFLLRFPTEPGPEMRLELERRGMRVLQYVPDAALMVASRATPDLEGLGVLSAAALEASYKISPLLADEVTGPLLVVFYADVDIDRKSTRLNSSHLGISYAVFCLK